MFGMVQFIGHPQLDWAGLDWMKAALEVLLYGNSAEGLQLILTPLNHHPLG
jgi:hypothetical protein